MADSERPGRGQSNAATAIALIGLIFAGGALLGLVALVLPQVTALLLVVILVFVVPAGLHYLLWGWRRAQVREDESEE
jgi:hypothetical protein